MRLRDALSLQRGTTYKSLLLGEPGPVLLGLASIQRNGGFRTDSLRTYGGESPAKLLLAPGELFVSLKDVTQAGDLLGAVARVPSEVNAGRLTQDTVKLVFAPTAAASMRSLIYWLLRTPDYREYCRGRAMGTTNLSLSREDFLNYPVPEPTPARTALVRLLDDLERKTALNRKTGETLEAMARALFKSWFLDFDPVRAKMKGRRPEGMDAEMAALFPNAFEESEFGEVPAGWRAAPLVDWVTALSGGTPAKSDETLWSGDIPWISPKVMTSIHADDADDFVTRKAIGNGTRLVPAGSTLVMVRGMGLHQKVRVSQARAAVTFNQDVKALVPNGIESSLLLFALLNGQASLLSQVESSGHGTGRLPSDILLAHRIAMPSGIAQRALAAYFDAVNDRIASARAETRTLAELRDHLLPKLMSGELRMRAAE